jgi:hypothetical protein
MESSIREKFFLINNFPSRLNLPENHTKPEEQIMNRGEKNINIGKKIFL